VAIADATMVRDDNGVAVEGIVDFRRGDSADQRGVLPAGAPVEDPRRKLAATGDGRISGLVEAIRHVALDQSTTRSGGLRRGLMAPDSISLHRTGPGEGGK
jgi:hypothetical protein